MKTITLLGAAIAALSPIPVQAQEDHSQHQGHNSSGDMSGMDMSTQMPAATVTPATTSIPTPTSTPSPTPPVPAPAMQDHSQHQGHDMGDMNGMNHSKMDHSKMDHAQMGHDMDVGGAEAPYTTGSGTSRLPGAEGGGHSGLHIPTGDNWMVMAHGFANTVYTDQTGPRGDDKLYVQSMLGLMAERDTD